MSEILLTRGWNDTEQVFKKNFNCEIITDSQEPEKIIQNVSCFLHPTSPSGGNIVYNYRILSKPGNLNWYNCFN